MTFDDAFRKLLGVEGDSSASRIALLRLESKGIGNLLDGLPSSEPQFHGITTAPKQVRPLAHRMSFIAKGDANVAPEVIGLLLWRGPANISRFIPLVCIDPVNGGARRGVPHVRIKGRKVVAPFFAHCDPAASVQRVFFRVGVKAPLLHLNPRRIRAGVSGAVRGGGLCRPFSMETAARTGVPACKFRGSNQRGVAAVAKASPSRNRAPIRICRALTSVLHNKSSESVVC